MYLKVPNLPQNRVTTVIVDYRISKESENTLKNKGINVLKTAKLNNLYQAVNGHPDMQIHHLGGNLFVCENTLYDYYKNLLPDAIIVSGCCLSSEYPYDIAFNAARVGDFCFHNLKYTDSQILEYYKRKGVKLINVKQGYSKCSVCLINENSIITSDIKIAEKASKIGIDTLYFDSNEIILKNLNHGFVGGIGGLIDKNVLAINGNIANLNNHRGLLKFCQNKGVKIQSLSDSIPEDIGSIIPIKEARML